MMPRKEVVGSNLYITGRYTMVWLSCEIKLTPTELPFEDLFSGKKPCAVEARENRTINGIRSRKNKILIYFVLR